MADGDFMEQKDDYSQDTGAIENVADDDMVGIAQDIENARADFDTTGRGAAEAFLGHTSIWSGLVDLGDPPFATLSAKWNQASVGIAVGMATSQGRVDDAAENLRQTADEYDGVEARVTAQFESLLQQLNER